MKHLKILIAFSALLFALSFQPAHSQSQLLNIKPSKATLTNTDTAYLVINYVQYTDVLSFHYVQKKVTGQWQAKPTCRAAMTMLPGSMQLRIH